MDMNAPKFSAQHLSPLRRSALLGEVRLRSMPSPRMPYQPSLGSPIGQPLAGKHRLGEFGWDRLPSSMLFMTTGAAGFYVSSALPAPADVILKAIGIGAFGWGVYNLLSAPADAKIDPNAPPKPQKTPSPPAFQLISGTIMTPGTDTKPKMNLWTWGTNFDATIAWYNGSEEMVNFAYDLVADAVVSPGIPEQGKTWVTQAVYTGKIANLQPMHDTSPITITVPVVWPPKAGLVGRGIPAPVVYMTLQLRKYDKNGVPIPTGERVRVGPFDFVQT